MIKSKMDINVFPTPQALSKAVARFFIESAHKAIEKSGRFTVALSGGSSPRGLYELLGSHPLKKEIPWEKTFVFWGDERFVLPTDSENNARMARKILLRHVPIPKNQIFSIPTDGSPEDAARRYASTLSSIFDQNLPSLDLILLGLGENGHTASLFPETEVLEEGKKWTGTIYLKEKDQHRITLTAPVINNAKNIVFLVYGKEKAQILADVIESPHQPKQWPAQLIKPKNGSLKWFVDEAAVTQLSQINS